MPKDASSPWTLPDSCPEDAPLVLETLAAVIEHSEGRIRVLSCDQAELIAKIRRAVDIDPWDAYLVARMYQRTKDASSGNADLDVFLAFAPWRTKEAFHRYLDACKGKHIRTIYGFMVWREGEPAYLISFKAPLGAKDLMETFKAIGGPFHQQKEESSNG